MVHCWCMNISDKYGVCEFGVYEDLFIFKRGLDS